MTGGEAVHPIPSRWPAHQGSLPPIRRCRGTKTADTRLPGGPPGDGQPRAPGASRRHAGRLSACPLLEPGGSGPGDGGRPQVPGADSGWRSCGGHGPPGEVVLIRQAHVRPAGGARGRSPRCAPAIPRRGRSGWAAAGPPPGPHLPWGAWLPAGEGAGKASQRQLEPQPPPGSGLGGPGLPSPADGPPATAPPLPPPPAPP